MEYYPKEQDYLAKLSEQLLILDNRLIAAATKGQSTLVVSYFDEQFGRLANCPYNQKIVRNIFDNLSSRGFSVHGPYGYEGRIIISWLPQTPLTDKFDNVIPK